MKSNQARYRSGYYAWFMRPSAMRKREDVLLGDRIEAQRGTYGVSRRKGSKRTRPDRDARPAPDPVERKVVADAPDQLWVADITYVST